MTVIGIKTEPTDGELMQRWVHRKTIPYWRERAARRAIGERARIRVFRVLRTAVGIIRQGVAARAVPTPSSRPSRFHD